jgi:AraC-like DNA-binding protein
MNASERRTQSLKRASSAPARASPPCPRMKTMEELSRWTVLAHQAAYEPNKLAKVFGISIRALDLHFERHCNVGSKAWLLELRLTNAYEDLHGGNPPAEVSAHKGFRRYSDFARSFKKRFGMCPASFAGWCSKYRIQATTVSEGKEPGSPLM